MKNKKALIIGGGIAGLCTGVYLRRAGFDTEILEMHTLAGGLATAWTRKGYTFENCVHWLVGSKPGADMNAQWKEVFDIDRLLFHNDDVYEVIEKDGDRMTVFQNVDRLEREWLDKAPGDAAAIREFSGLVRKLSRFRTNPGDSLIDRLKFLAGVIPFLPTLGRYSKLTMGKFALKFKHPLLREFFGVGLSDLSFLAIAFALAWMTNRNAGYPIGGSPIIIGLIEERYKSLGGKIRFGARVEKIVVENGRAAGVLLAGGERLSADIVVSAADGHATIFDMLEGKYVSDKINKIYATYKRFPSYVQVSLGVAADFKKEPPFLYTTPVKTIEIDPETRRDSLSIRIFNFDPTFAPAGKTALVAFFTTTNDEYWVALRQNDRNKYEAEKSRIAAEVITAVEARFPAAAGKVEVADVATPATVVRYTGNWRGSMEGWLMTPASGIKQLPSVLPGLKNFYMVGQWISPGGGLPSGLLTGRNVTRRICKDFGLPWKAN
ncbi:MAG: NAD(P)/FAD-dependent oxidoreductase [Candidatus Aminicenantes bacterium]|nr:NAD(P)/FAD-dependent oxidoreductase [Candidatus Aminicenantes bacterium]